MLSPFYPSEVMWCLKIHTVCSYTLNWWSMLCCTHATPNARDQRHDASANEHHPSHPQPWRDVASTSRCKCKGTLTSPPTLTWRSINFTMQVQRNLNITPPTQQKTLTLRSINFTMQVQRNVNITVNITPPTPPPTLTWRSINFMMQLQINVNITPPTPSPTLTWRSIHFMMQLQMNVSIMQMTWYVVKQKHAYCTGLYLRREQKLKQPPKKRETLHHQGTCYLSIFRGPMFSCDKVYMVDPVNQLLTGMILQVSGYLREFTGCARIIPSK